MVMEGIQEDIGDGNMQCMNHPYKNSSPGGICAFCLQEKLGKLVSSSFSSSSFPSSSSSSSVSRSDFVATSSTTTSTLQIPTTTNKNTTDFNYHPYDNNNTTRKSRMHSLLTQKKKSSNGHASVNMTSSGSDSGIAFKRSKSTTTPRNHLHFLEANESEDFGPNRKGFWSFLHYSSSKHYSSTGSSMNSSTKSRDQKKKEEIVVVEENESPNEASFNNKVARSRSVGCGSRSFSGDLFEKISTGFGDCTLRRIESQRESTKPRFSSVHHKERVNCGGILSYLVSSEVNAKSHHISNGRSYKNWGWALASPMRAFSKTSSGKREDSTTSNNNKKNVTPNLDAIPSLLTVSS